MITSFFPNPDTKDTCRTCIFHSTFELDDHGLTVEHYCERAPGIGSKSGHKIIKPTDKACGNYEQIY